MLIEHTEETENDIDFWVLRVVQGSLELDAPRRLLTAAMMVGRLQAHMRDLLQLEFARVDTGKEMMQQAMVSAAVASLAVAYGELRELMHMGEQVTRARGSQQPLSEQEIVAALERSPFPQQVRDFNAHLQECAQCREQPFNLCAAGAGLLELGGRG